MKRIRGLKIGRRCFRVLYRQLETIYGQIHLDVAKVEIADDLTEEEHAYAIVHEVMHGIWHFKNIPERAREERVVTDLSWGLVAVFRDNPGLLKHIEKLVGEAR